MKKLLFAAVMVLAVCAWAQTWSSTPGQSPDTVYTRVTVAMCPFQFSYNNGTTGSAHTAPALTFGGVSVDTLRYSLAECIDPCEVVDIQNWIENIGGVTADFNILVEDVVYGTTTNWHHHDVATTCAGLTPLISENVCGGMFDFGTSNPVAEAPTWTVLPEALGTDEIENVFAEDPASTGDNTWTAGERDQRNLHIGMIAPASASDTQQHSMRVLLIGKVSD